MWLLVIDWYAIGMRINYGVTLAAEKMEKGRKSSQKMRKFRLPQKRDFGYQRNDRFCATRSTVVGKALFCPFCVEGDSFIVGRC